MDRQLLAELAELPPVKWRETAKRHAVVTRYLVQPNRSVDVVDQHAAEAGVGRSLFYRLARILRERRDGVEHAPYAKGGRSTSSLETDFAVADAIEELGRSARPSEILARAGDLCRERGVPEPTERRIRTLYIRQGAGADAADRLRVDADLAIDVAPLALVTRYGEDSAIAHLSTLLDLRQGVVVAHTVTCGRPDQGHVQDVLDCRPAFSTPTRLTLPIEHLIGEVRGHLRLPPGVRIAKGRAPGAGSAVRAVLGDHLGRIPLLRREPSGACPPPTVDLELARGVVDHLLADRRGGVDHLLRGRDAANERTAAAPI